MIDYPNNTHSKNTKDILILQEEFMPEQKHPRDTKRVYLQLMVQEIAVENESKEQVQIVL